MREGLQLFHLFRVICTAAVNGATPKTSEFILWNSRIHEVFSGEAFATFCNRGIPPEYHAEMEYCGSLASLPEGKTFESPDKTLNHLRFWVIRAAGNQ
jgi:hypothetical protein